MFQFNAAVCKMGKIANNLEKHGTDDVTEFNIPIIGVMLDSAQLCDLTGDPFTHRSWFNMNRDLPEPMSWWHDQSFKLHTKFKDLRVAIKLQSDEVLEFIARAKDLDLTPQVGGLTACDFTLQLCPGLDRENLLLQEYQNRGITLTVGGGAVDSKTKPKQGELPMKHPETVQPSASGDDGNPIHEIAKHVENAA